MSLASHIVFAVLGVGMPALMGIAEGLGLRRKDAIWKALARRWSKAFGILFAVGAASGTVLSFFLGTAVAAVAGGWIRAPQGNVTSGFWAGWTTGLALVIGLLAVAMCAYLAATYLMVET